MPTLVGFTVTPLDPNLSEKEQIKKLQRDVEGLSRRLNDVMDLMNGMSLTVSDTKNKLDNIT